MLLKNQEKYKKNYSHHKDKLRYGLSTSRKYVTIPFEI
ncbi:unnamed protein product [Paramecium primaurelia]|uniref:Uncharacterized protein n=1 Tax=Paramecium primaurelia TaxID=5886 RepID=A0A8S1KAW9_PARPR|nr:unnamed protein product [Paramecium primaurelia]